MIRTVFLLTILLMSANWAESKQTHLYSEKEYQTAWCSARNGQMEYVLPNRARVDCLLPNMAVEIDFAKKFHECIGQALEYAALTKKTPACVLIVEKYEDWHYVNRLRYTVYNKKNIPQGKFRTFTIKPETLMQKK